MFDCMSIEKFDQEIRERGWVVFEKILPDELTQALREDSLKWIDVCSKYQIKNGINTSGDGTAHQCIGGNDSIDRFIDMHLFHKYIARYFDDKPYICNCCTPIGGFPGANIYVHQVHRDVRTFIPGYHLRLNMLIMCDDFTLENGATYVLSGSHKTEGRPDDDVFERQHERIVAPAGSVSLFNSALWHRGGHNATDRKRVALTIGYGRPFVKPQMDYARMLGEDYGRGLSPLTRQVLGYNARVPVSLDEWYRPVAERLYHADQG
ncbi:phytanoyl-CoA dioxygenase family protein [Billgrantia aerodenitrificans]|uniref:Phytanoyl-CoA dioxygenase n=1 Tax=Billgrantia aerodenitrificans TaxID=2733483 RepID=A0ABS9AVI0_9GAMM|nr:phytanoyl-CoA dioxygenase family protein [Halomonas aerodenitrificans]MCE8025895.1 phytanoyl-CoA dioxygenase [Halomonas aerodenitrificans]